MARKKAQKQGKKAPRQSRALVPRTILDSGAKSYAALLLDPCGAPLARPLYNSTGSGYLIRLEASMTFATDATNDGFRYTLIPGAYDTQADGASCRKAAMWSLSPSTSANYPYTFNSAAVPGWNFQGIMDSWRAVAACVELTYIGKETDRAGMIGFRQTDYEALSNSPLSPLQALGASQRTLRTPADTVTFRWSPTEGDSVWTNKQAAVDSDSERDKGKTGVEVSIVGIGSFRVRSTVVYEWRPNGAGDMSVGAQTPVASSHTVRDVLQFLGSMGDWTFKTAHDGAVAASKLVAGYRAGKALVSGMRSMAIMGV